MAALSWNITQQFPCDVKTPAAGKSPLKDLMVKWRLLSVGAPERLTTLHRGSGNGKRGSLKSKKPKIGLTGVMTGGLRKGMSWAFWELE